jgi:hypothetical protein
VSCPDLPDRHQALRNAAWRPYGPTLAHRPGEGLSAYVRRVRATIDLRDPELPEPVRTAMATLIGMCSAVALAGVTGYDTLDFIGPSDRN